MFKESFASFWLSRAAVAAIVVYVYSAVRIWRLSPNVLANRLAAILCVDLAAWALQAAISYAADDPAITVALSKALSWTWPFFPAIGLHFGIEIGDTKRRLSGRTRTFVVVAIYASALYFYWLMAGPLLRGAIKRAGYWSVDIIPGPGFTAFSIYYLAFNLGATVLVAAAWFRARGRRERARLGIIVVTHIIALFGGFTTDTVLLALHVDFPKVGVLWASVWAVGLNVAMERYGFLAPFSPRDTGLLMDRFVERSMDGIMVSDAYRRVIYWNDPLVTLTGITAGEAIGRDMMELQRTLAPDGSQRDLIADTISLSASHPDEHGQRLVEFEIRRRDGENRWLQTSAFTIPSAEGDIRAFILRDVTGEKRAAAEALEQLRRQGHAQKMEALGSLVGGIAHDFNNTLGGIVGAVSLIRACLDTDDSSKPIDFSRELEIISRSTQRAAATVRGLMAFANNTPQRNEPFRLDQTLQHIADFAGRTLDRAAHVVANDLSPEAVVIGDAPQVEQLILNLVINSEHAVTIMRPIGAVKGGTIGLSLRRQEPGDDFIAAHPNIAPVPYWALSVSDDGVGMDQNTLARAFDPFFTTKASDQGSGLGLSMAHLIARQHGGFIEGRSEPGRGSTFTVYLPAACASVAPAIG